MLGLDLENHELPRARVVRGLLAEGLAEGLAAGLVCCGCEEVLEFKSADWGALNEAFGCTDRFLP